MNLRIAIAAAALMGSTSVFSAVTLTAPEEINIVAVNEQEVNSGLIRKNQTYKIDPGSNSISVRYTEFFEHTDSTHDILKSGVVTVKTPELKDGESYRLALINAPKDFNVAQKYKDQPIIGLYDAKNQLLVQQVGANSEAKPLLGKSVLGKAVDLTTKTLTPVNQPAPVYTQAAVAPVVAKVNTAQTAAQTSTDQALIQLWQKASKAERQKFMSWLAEQAD
ncbi:hypothetical protein BS636_12220 [Acinetobacter sp. LoGeW2-3]|uniref:DUF2057 family protein n=1 Tax=Acinetobacter sp. LoGeW2-3 TaxID=1808001 RepID=UPI000C05A1C4|nr:DUF2057 family protein [Acinetobacter sp. LoGeW2-3]ATO20380.1 hypothetical protein BS636_12220 [Acinetobacter sp. LoGeW2-3]